MSDLPDPLTPADCDLRGYDFMPLHGGKLFGSRFYMKSLRNPRAGLAAIKLWWAAWQQCPAGSLPNDDDDLSILADFGTDTKGWTKCRDVALHGFVLCSDGRLYHPMLCAEAKDAYARRVSERERKAAQRAAKKNKTAKTENGTSDGKSGDIPDVSHGTTNGHDSGRDADFRSDRTVTGQDSNTLTSFVPPDGAERCPDQDDLPPVARPSAAPQPQAAAGSQPPDARKLLFSTGLLLVRRLTGKPEGPTRALIGRWLKTAKDDAALVAAVVGDAADLRPADPIAWIEKALRQRSGSQQDRLAAEWALSGPDMDAEADRFAEEDGF